MKTLTIWQPYAQAIALGIKRYETRSWKLSSLQPGDSLAIHASKKHTRHAATRDMVGCAKTPMTWLWWPTRTGSSPANRSGR